MGEEKMVTEREARKREQRAFIRGREHGLVYHHDCSSEAARSFYPLPKRVVPRVVKDPEPGYTQGWRWFEGRLQYRCEYDDNGCSWLDAVLHSGGVVNCLHLTPNRLALFASLAANPTEEIDDDGSDRDA